MIYKLLYRYIYRINLEKLVLYSRLIVYLTLAFVFIVYFVFKGRFWLLGDLISMEPSNLAFSVMFFLMILFKFGGNLGKLEYLLATALILIMYESLTFLIGVMVFTLNSVFPSSIKKTFICYLLLSVGVALIAIFVTDTFQVAKLYFYQIRHASGYVWFNGWESATYAFAQNPLGSGILSSNNYYRDAISDDLFDNLNLRGLGSMNAYFFAAFGVYYFIALVYVFVKTGSMDSNFGMVVLNVYLFMLLGRWAGIFNGTFILSFAFFMYMQNSELRKIKRIV